MRKLSDSREEHGAGRNVETIGRITCHFFSRKDTYGGLCRP